jgi:hypothetical protein
MSEVSIYGVLSEKPERFDVERKGWAKRYGLAFPIGKQTEGGYFAKQAGIELAKKNLHQLLATERGERIMLPNYGANLKRFLFQPMDSFLFREIKEEIISAVSNYAPQVTLNKLSVFPLDDYGAEGLQALKIVLIASLKEYEDLIFDVEVKIA